MQIYHRGKSHFAWKGDKTTKRAIHLWLSYNFGKANKCENPECLGSSKTYQWANLKNHKHSHKREDYKMLCVSCHRKLDRRKDYCKNGHKYTEENTYWYKDKSTRYCKTCNRKYYRSKNA